MSDLNWFTIAILTLMSWVGGSFWFGPLFGKTWMKIHEYEKKSKAEQEKAMEGMWTLLVSELVASAMMIIALAWLITTIPEYSEMTLALFVWGGFILPMTVSNIVWGGDKKQWMIPKILLTTGYRLLILVISAYILSVW